VLDSPVPDTIDNLLGSFANDRSSADIAGQFFTFGFEGTKYTPELGSWFGKLKPGGVILFSRNIVNSDQTATLISDLKKLCEDETGVSPFVACDQEGGRVSRLPFDAVTQQRGSSEKTGFAQFPPSRELADSGSENSVNKTYAQMGLAMKTLGFNLDFAPVLDLDTNSENPVIGDRSFGADPEKVATMGRAAIRGLRSVGILTCAKHFPGHGDTSLDSHLDLPVDNRPAERFNRAELAPFRMAVAENVEFIMTAHVMYPGLDDRYPATLSRKILTDILRAGMNYQGVIVSDDMDMKAITGRYEDSEAAKLAMEAGVDHILSCRDHRRQQDLVTAVRRMIDDGTVDNKRAMDKLKRSLMAKQKAAYYTLS